MSTTRSRQRRTRRAADSAHADDERWLLTYADMITLLMALFMVMFSISSVNTSKFESLQRALEEAFSGKILPGSRGTTESGGAQRTAKRPSMEPLVPAIQPIDTSGRKGSDVRKEDEDFRRLKEQVDRYANEHGIASRIETSVRQRGLVIRVLTDPLLFESGEARVRGEGAKLLDKVAHLLARDGHAIAVEGHTDSIPIATAVYPSNWELSTARAASVVRSLAGAGVRERRFEAAGYAALHPIDSNETRAGRSHNRRVEIVLLRAGRGRQKGPVTP
jgi:chemotaxis protein MotB